MVKSEMLERMFQNLPDESVDKIKNMHLLGIPEAEDIANMAVYLISDLSSHITGTSITIDSGYSLS
jgi:enoyl-[acyl-carrier-protein] reductase (NADH)